MSNTTAASTEEMSYLSSKNILLGLQHLFAMFGSIVLTSRMAGLNTPVCMFTAGLGTLIFHLVTKGKVPIFVGASTAYVATIASVVFVTDASGNAVRHIENIPYVQGGVMAAGLVYCILACVAYFVGHERIKRWFPPIVVGPVIMVIGTKLAPKAIGMAQQNWLIAIITLAVVIYFNVYGKGLLKIIPILIGIASGYVCSIIYDMVAHPATPLVDFTPLAEASWIQPFWDFSGQFFSFPKFDMSIIFLIAPIAFVTFMEHIGDITTNGAVVGKDFLSDPGIHRTLLGDGLSTMASGFFGGNANTTFSQNTGLLAVTGAYNPKILRTAAVMAICLSLFGKLGGLLQSIPNAVIGGVSILLFGSIASIGVRTVAEAKIDFAQSRNIIIVAVILVIGLGLAADGVMVGTVKVSGRFLAVVAGVLCNSLLPKVPQKAD
ncbi:uracil-xanthine permease family protein [Anaerotruncus rubiinfantis]|uniref:uracil-xanthine permease family protein n=1 Tax=Anaerotruncus rubiinfantis TaxID=1720200 RepID=UPI0034A4F54D